jgi:hypothetical protein
MRTASCLLVLAAVVFGAFTLAGADDGVPSPEDMAKRLEALEMQVKFLRQREGSLTRYIMHNEKRAAGIQDTVTRARAEGFEKSKTPTPSRIVLLKGMEDLGKSLAVDLPLLTKEQEALYKKIQALDKMGDKKN